MLPGVSFPATVGQLRWAHGVVRVRRGSIFRPELAIGQGSMRGAEKRKEKKNETSRIDKYDRLLEI